MLQQLPETKGARERRWRWTVPSVGIHVAIITAVAFAPARGVEAPKPVDHVVDVIYNDPMVPVDHANGPTGSVKGRQTASDLPKLPQPDFNATSIATTTPTVWSTSADTTGISELLAGGQTGSLSAAPSGAIGESTADEPVRVRIESLPHYPASLRAVGITGVVEMEFVVDTTGRADLATARVVSSPDQRFSDAVRAALRGARFVPGRYQGHAVRTLVRRAFRFEMGADR